VLDNFLIPLRKVYFISGLGADKRSFSFLDLSFCDPVFIDWIQPLPAESLAGYALRLKEQITEQHPIIVGVSFGGMLVTEMAKADPQIKAIIISSNKTANEFPSIYRTGKYLPAYKWVPPTVLKRTALFRSLFFGPKGEKQKETFRKILNDSDTRFTKWAIHSILNWKNKEVPENITHIHGTSDKLLPYRKVKADYAIEKGTHLMIMNQPEEISNLIKKLIV
jgi:pimeloyl-ACP methyl ester carboxylesterase